MLTCLRSKLKGYWESAQAVVSGIIQSAPIHTPCRYVKVLIKILSVLLAAVAIGATAAAMHEAIQSLVAWRNRTLQLFYTRSLLQVRCAG